MIFKGVAQERARCLAVVDSHLKAWRRYMGELGEDARVDPYTVEAELELLREQIINEESETDN
jgi:hypothetical protein